MVASDRLTCVFHATGNTLVLQRGFRTKRDRPVLQTALCDIPHVTPGGGGGTRRDTCTDEKPVH